MINSNIKSGNGYQSLHGKGASPTTISNNDLTSDYTESPQFSYKAQFLESSTEARKELSVALGLSANIYNISPEFKGSISKILENDSTCKYCIVELRREYGHSDVNFGTAKNFSEMLQTLIVSPEQYAEFYQNHGDRLVSHVVHGEKLVVVIRIESSHLSKATKWLFRGNLNVPVTGTTAVGASVDFLSALNMMEDEFIGNIEIFSVGVNSPNLEIESIKTIGSLRNTLQQYIKGADVAGPSKNETATEDKNPKKDSNSKNDNQKEDKDSKNDKKEDKNAVANPEPKPESKAETKPNPKGVIIDYSTTSYARFLSKEEMPQYRNYLRFISRAIKYLQSISECHARATNYLDKTRMVLEDPETFKLDKIDRERIESIQADLSQILERLEIKTNYVMANVFLDNDEVNDKYNIQEADSLETKKRKFLGTIWNEICNTANYLNKLTDPVIDFRNSRYFLGELSSESKPYAFNWRFHRSSGYTNLIVPYQTKEIVFQVQGLNRDLSEQERSNLIFGLLRRNPVQVTGHQNPHRTLYEALKDYSVREPLYLMNSVDKTKSSATRILAKQQAYLSTEKNKKIYNHVAICSPHGAEGPFVVRIYAHWGPDLKPLRFDDKNPPEGDVSSEPIVPVSKKSKIAQPASQWYSVLLSQDIGKSSGGITPGNGDEQDRNIYKLHNNPTYQLQSHDINYVCEVLFGKDKHFIYMPVQQQHVNNNGDLVRALTETARPALDSGHEILSIFNANSDHWVAYRMAKVLENDAKKGTAKTKLVVYYKDSYGSGPTRQFLDALNAVFKDHEIEVIPSDTNEQKDDKINCGVFAIENLRILSSFSLPVLQKHVNDNKRLEIKFFGQELDKDIKSELAKKREELAGLYKKRSSKVLIDVDERNKKIADLNSNVALPLLKLLRRVTELERVLDEKKVTAEFRSIEGRNEYELYFIFTENNQEKQKLQKFMKKLDVTYKDHSESNAAETPKSLVISEDAAKTMLRQLAKTALLLPPARKSSGSYPISNREVRELRNDAASFGAAVDDASEHDVDGADESSPAVRSTLRH